ncbi:phage tail protein [Acinetobacter sp. 256-1]|uniref:TipJ family phage tail tip protein n=1 Tax=Acinetobacter sp. 256-1 TaxID=2746721 RepID=UPI002578C027|nr:phage tail protein [Acinetobacter sp. 256-1]MDM1758129.1 phage tail protein [Acinetobacter sp. 256-1]
MSAMIKGEKAGSKKARQAVVAPDSAQSKTYIKILYGLSEGKIKGLSHGFQSIYLDDTPLHDANGNSNFENITVDTRLGTNDQDYIEGFPDISSETAIGVELKSASPWVKAFTNLDMDAVRVRLKWGPLREQNQENGDVNGITIQYAIDVQTDGGTWTEVLNTQVTDKTSANYERSHRIDLPKASKGWQIRVRRITPNATSEFISDKMYVEAVTEVIDAKLRYPNTALLGLQYDAETFSNVAKVAVECDGIEILVPTNYNPETRQYLGLWNGTFKRAYTNNPAWHFYDACITKRYALGDRINSSMIDKWSIYRLAQYCDQLVPDGSGGEEPRFTLNVYEQSQEDAWTVLSKMAGVFRAFIYWDGKSIVCDADVPQDTYFTYTSANVIDGLFEYSGTRARDRHTVAKVAWDNPKNRYKTEYIPVRDEPAISRLGIRIADISAWGCTSEGQAQRAGLWALKSEQYETRTVTFKVGLDGYIPLPGKVIEIADPIFAGRANGGRISKVSTDLRQITLDRDNVVCKAGDRLVVNGEDGKAQARVVQSINGRMVTVVAAFDSVAPQNVWVIDAQDLATMKFRVVSITQDESHQFTITGLQYNPAKYDAIDFGAVIDDRPITIITPTVQAPVASVTVSAEHMVQQGLTVATMLITWPQAQAAVKYLVEWRKDDGSWIKLPLTGNNSVEVQGIYSGSYQARVTAISAFDVSSLPTYSALTELKGKAGQPPKLAFIKATGTMFGMKVEWGFPVVGALDTAHTEIEVSTTSNGANASVQGLFAYPTTSTQIQGLAANVTLWYRGRLIDRIGNMGDWSDWTSGTSTAQVSDILDALSGQITESQLHKDLTTKIDKIDTIAGLDGDIGNLIDKITEVESEVDATNTALNKETQDRINAVKNTNDSLTQEIIDRTKADAAEALARTDAINKEVKDRQTAINTVTSSVDKEVTDRISAVKTVQDGLTVEIQDRKAGDSAILNVVETYKKSTDTSVAAVQQSVEVVARDLSATATKTDAVYAITMPATADATDPTADSSVIAASWSIQSAMAEADSALSQRIDTNVAKIGENSVLIQSETTARINADLAIGQRIDTLNASFNENQASIQQELKVLADTDKAQTQALNTYISSNDQAVASAVSDIKTATDKANANALSISGLDTRLKVAETDSGKALENSASALTTANTAVSKADSAASIANQATATANTAKSTADTAKTNAATALSKATAAADQSSANASKIDALTVDLAGKASAGALDSVKTDVKNQGDKITANTERLNGVYAKVTPVTSDTTKLTADSGTVDAASWTLQSAFAEDDLALSQRIDTVSASVVDNKALIQQEVTARADGDSANAQALNLYKASNDLALAAVSEKVNVVTTDNAANASKITALDSRLVVAESDASTAKTNAATAVSKAETAVSQSNANASKIDALTVDLAGKASAGALDSVKTDVKNQGDKITANTERLNGVYAKVTPVTSDTTKLTADSGTVDAASWTLQSAFAEDDLALSQRLDITQAQVNDNKAAIVTEQTARVDADSAIGQRIDVVQSDFQNNKSVVLSQIKTLSDAQSAQSSRIDTVQSTVGEHTSSIQTQQTSINGLTARATLKLQSGNLIGGVGIENDSKTVDFIIQANKFAIGAPSGVSGVSNAYAFIYQSTAYTLPNGTIIPKGLYLDDAYIGSINANKIHADSLSAISAKLGTIYSDNYVQNKSGWAISSKTGTFEMNSSTSQSQTQVSGNGLRVIDRNGVVRIEIGEW